MKNYNSNNGNMVISEPLWQLYQDVYFYPFMSTSHYVNGAIISLWNEHGDILSSYKNKKIQNRAIKLISRVPAPIKYLYGGNHDMSYRELSISLNISLSLAQKLSQRFNQRAFYFVENDKFTLYNSFNLKQCYTFKEPIAKRMKRVNLPTFNSAQL
ncbi:hypothetical protein [Pseudoalteromonas luteoviolacea]|uniref:Uncharacterized protein n=1 Tax=Pseudoalteromonas luteoviolacea H33 TaxID=1365251 RepID=A0A166ZRH2_9GAMM|nr:hypothetical protein [Pseudoalteromonas luteoviolacea]KZN44584.1 hypothetical protein N476_06175 [Pseudoalteromonas luteoviolacea H33]KZN75386.1 hypothetical protein N477_19185 [Pseudoalteromonas luteoviolacea H33-S]MBQ4879605.1 hypothetical protein [Pseudoalteromonas luteoviolacea]MBQ4908738.1 hypothetical protein [Pseudoalteromonas luteoviolacea]